MVGRLIGSMTVLAIAVGVSAPPATACNQPDIEVSTKHARPGDWVNFTVSATDAGAGYTVYVQGQEVATGTDPDGGGVASRFEMPDLGDHDLPAAIEVKVTHPNPGNGGGDFHGGAPWWGSTPEVGYRARAQTPAPQRTQKVQRAADPAPRAKPKRKPAARTKAVKARKAKRSRRARERKRRADRRERRRRGAAEEADITAPATPVSARSDPTRREVAEVQPTGIGMKGAVGILFLLTVGCAGYGRFSARRGAL